MRRDPLAYEMAERAMSLEIVRTFPAWGRVIARHVNEALGYDAFLGPERERARKLGLEAGEIVWREATASILDQIEGGDRELSADLPRLLDRFGEESRRINWRGHHLHEEGMSLDLCRIFDDAASEIYLRHVRGFIRATVEDLERIAGTRDNIAFAAVGLAFNELTAFFVLPQNFEHGQVAPQNVEAARVRYTALLHRIMIASGDAEKVERSA